MKSIEEQIPRRSKLFAELETEEKIKYLDVSYQKVKMLRDTRSRPKYWFHTWWPPTQGTIIPVLFITFIIFYHEPIKVLFQKNMIFIVSFGFFWLMYAVLRTISTKADRTEEVAIASFVDKLRVHRSVCEMELGGKITPYMDDLNIMNNNKGWMDDQNNKIA